MNRIFVIQDQNGRFLSRHHEWVANDREAPLFRTPHRDLALNELFELTARDTELRARVVDVPTGARGTPLVDGLPPREPVVSPGAGADRPTDAPLSHQHLNANTSTQEPVDPC